MTFCCRYFFKFLFEKKKENNNVYLVILQLIWYMQLSNEHSEFILKKYLEQSVSDSQKISFFLLTGSQSALKSDLVCKLAKEIL